MNDKKVLKYLTDKYAVDFVIESTEYISNINQYQIKAYPFNQEEVKIVVEFYPDNDRMSDNYIESHYQNEAKSYMTSLFSDLEIPFVFTVSHSYFGIISDPKNLPDWKTLYDQEASEMTLVFKLNVFSKPSNDLLNQFVVLDELLRAKQLKKSGFFISFFEPSVIAGKELDTFDFSYSMDSDYFEYQNKDQFICKILYYINKKNPPIEVAQLEKLLNVNFLYLRPEFI